MNTVKVRSSIVVGIPGRREREIIMIVNFNISAIFMAPNSNLDCKHHVFFPMGTLDLIFCTFGDSHTSAAKPWLPHDHYIAMTTIINPVTYQHSTMRW